MSIGGAAAGGERPLILVTGATGNQGGAVVDALFEHQGQWRVRALTRDPGGGAAQALQRRGAEIVGGDMADAATLRTALEGVHGVFSVQNSRSAGLKAEVEQGVTLADAARAADVRHFVYSSVGGAERSSGVPHFATKWRIEQHLRDIGLPHTVLRPTTFMDVFTMRAAGIGLSMMAGALGPDTPLQMIAVRDIGIFARMAFEQPESFLGEAIEIAGDELTVPQIASALRADGRAIRYARLPKAMLRAMGRESRMFFWFAESGYCADIDRLRGLHPDLLTLGSWLSLRVGKAGRNAARSE
jgi:uncharacterized protein YbjT (DUF2867 family)